MNTDAWLFPYSWVHRIFITSLKIKVHVSGMSSLKIYNPLGEVDASVHFPLFGLEAQKGSWFAFGNYEIAIKPIQSMGITLQWADLPYSEGGFYDLYQAYKTPIDNTTFKVEWEKLTDQKWVKLPESTSCLFNTKNKHTSPRGKLSEYSEIVYDKPFKNITVSTEEEQYQYMKAQQGFFRIRLTDPNGGFGQTEYRMLFADIMIRNSHTRKQTPVPKPPYNPMIESIGIGYSAEEEYFFNGDTPRDRCRIYHIHPLRQKELHEIDLRHPFPMVEVPTEDGIILFGIGNSIGNDQIRFELGIKALAPDIKIIAPWRSDKWNMDSRESEIEYCKAHGIHLPFSTDSSYSRDRNIWHISHEGLELEDPGNEPNYEHLLVLGVTPEKAPDEGEYVTMTFEKGVPTSVNGEKMKVSDIIRTLNKLGGKHGIGIVDIVENRVVGMKSRGVYETPGGTILMEAHQQLEELILDRDTYAFEKEMGAKFASLVYEGKWFTPLREAEQAFIEKTQEYVTGEVKFKLYKGNIIKAGTTSPYSLYNENLASFTTGDLYDHHDAEGFINLFGLSLKVRAMKLQENEKKLGN